MSTPTSEAAAFTHPIPATLAVVIRGDEVLLVRRANPPDAGLWAFPGGKIDAGEPLASATLRELSEETGVRAEADQVLTAIDQFVHAEDGTLRQHFILIAVLCRWRAGEPVAADDALEARWVVIADLDRNGLRMSEGVGALARQAVLVLRHLEGQHDR